MHFMTNFSIRNLYNQKLSRDCSFTSGIKRFIMLCVVVANIAFDSNNAALMFNCKNSEKRGFDVKLYDAGNHSSDGPVIELRQQYFFVRMSEVYSQRMLTNLGLLVCILVFRPLPNSANFTPRNDKEAILNPATHLSYRAIIWTLSYLATGSRFDSTLSVAVLVQRTYNLTMNFLECQNEFDAKFLKH